MGNTLKYIEPSKTNIMRTKRILFVLLYTFFIFLTGCEKPDKPEILVADFSYILDNVQPPVTVTFSNLSLNATSYLWDFGDNEGSSEINPSHIYQNEGYFTVKLTAFNSDGTSSITKTDFISIGIFKALRDAGLTVPEDMSVVGFDDLPAALLINPILTVAAQPAYEMGSQATDLLLKRIAGQLPEASQEIILPTEMIVRRSSGRPRGQS